MDRPSSLLRRWIAACAIGETLGIALAACWWVAVDRIDPEPVTLTAKLAMLAAKSAAGIVEGGLLGMLQAWALRLRYPALSPTGWTLATVALAVLGWAIGSSFAIFASAEGSAPPDPGLVPTMAMASGFGLAVGALFGLVQTMPLRRAAQPGMWWILFNAIGWAVALPAIYLAASADLGLGLAGVALGGLAGGAIAGALLGAVTSLAFAHMPPRDQ